MKDQNEASQKTIDAQLSSVDGPGLSRCNFFAGRCKVIAAAALLVVVGSLSAATLFATDDEKGDTRLNFQYAAKILCVANIPGTSSTTNTVLPGRYQTVVNIHNPNNQRAFIRMKIATTDPSVISEFRESQLIPDEAVNVDCDDITRDFGITFIHGAEGFLVIESDLSLDGMAVYTAGKNSDGQVESIAVEQVRERNLMPGRGKP